jgi:hypothetical protein
MQNVDPFLFRDEIWSSDTEDLEMLGFFKIETIRKKNWNTARVLAKQKLYIETLFNEKTQINIKHRRLQMWIA